MASRRRLDYNAVVLGAIRKFMRSTDRSTDGVPFVPVLFPVRVFLAIQKQYRRAGGKVLRDRQMAYISENDNAEPWDFSWMLRQGR